MFHADEEGDFELGPHWGGRDVSSWVWGVEHTILGFAHGGLDLVERDVADCIPDRVHGGQI